jgi:alkylhydroperoxidase/carboxymuconolactone decarboxylase family protein YurZ
LSNWLQVINSLTSLKLVTPPALIDTPASIPTSRTKSLHDPSSALPQGIAFFKKTYGAISDRITSQLQAPSPDLWNTAQLLYAHLLSEEAVLVGPESSYAIIAALIPQDVDPQLKGHLKGALNHGASVDQVKAVRGVVVGICQAAGMAEGPGRGWRKGVSNL